MRSIAIFAGGLALVVGAGIGVAEQEPPARPDTEQVAAEDEAADDEVQPGATDFVPSETIEGDTGIAFPTDI